MDISLSPNIRFDWVFSSLCYEHRLNRYTSIADWNLQRSLQSTKQLILTEGGQTANGGDPFGATIIKGFPLTKMMPLKMNIMVFKKKEQHILSGRSVFQL